MTNTQTVVMWPGFEVTFEQEGEWVTTATPERDPDWKYVDSAGHGHFYAADGLLPTLKWNARPCSMGHGDDCDSEGTWNCRLCDEEIHPGTRPARPVYIPGPRRITCTVTQGSTTTVYAMPQEAWEAFVNRGTEFLLGLASELSSAEHRMAP